MGDLPVHRPSVGPSVAGASRTMAEGYHGRDVQPVAALPDREKLPGATQTPQAQAPSSPVSETSAVAPLPRPEISAMTSPADRLTLQVWVRRAEAAEQQLADAYMRFGLSEHLAPLQEAELAGALQIRDRLAAEVLALRSQLADTSAHAALAAQLLSAANLQAQTATARADSQIQSLTATKQERDDLVRLGISIRQQLAAAQAQATSLQEQLDRALAAQADVGGALARAHAEAREVQDQLQSSLADADVAANEATRRATRLEDDLRTALARIAELETDLQGRAVEQDTVSLADLALIQQHERAVEVLRDEAAAMYGQLEAARAQVVDAQAMIADLEMHRAAGGQAVAGLTQHSERLHQERSALEVRVATLEAALTAATVELDERQTALNAIRTSTSWIVARGLARFTGLAPHSFKTWTRKQLSALVAISQRRRKGAAAGAADPTPTLVSALRSAAAMTGTTTPAFTALRTPPDGPNSLDVTIILATAASASMSLAHAALLRNAIERGAEVVACGGSAVALEGLLHIACPPGGDLAAHVDQLVRASTSRTAIVLTEDLSLAAGAIEEIVATFTANERVGALYGRTQPVEAAELQPHGYRGKTLQVVTRLAHGVIAFDTDAYVLAGGLPHGETSFAAALETFSSRATAAGVLIAYAPAVLGTGPAHQGARWIDHAPAADIVRPRARAVIFDLVTPTPDQDSGSVDLVWQMRILSGLGYEVTFYPTAERTHAGRYTDALRRERVHCALDQDYPDVWSFLVAEGKTFDLAVLSRVGAACHLIDPVRKGAPQARVVFNTVDLHFIREQREAEHNASPTMLANAFATRTEELKVVAAADATMVVSSSEANLLRSLTPDANVHHVPIVRAVQGLTGPLKGREGVMFVGGFRHQPNVDAARYLISEVWPLVRRMKPDLELNIIGSSAPEDIVSLAASADGVNMVGYVESLASWYRAIRVNVAPLRYGGGIKGKVVGSLCVGLPTVATSVAVDGMDVTNGTDVLVADDAEAFARAICRLCDDDALWSQLSSGGLATARAHYSVEAVSQRLFSMLRGQGLPT
jgi:hypothetical protein